MKVISERDAYKHTQRFDLEKPKWRCRANQLLCMFVGFAHVFGFLYQYDDLECRMCCLKKGCPYYQEAVMFLKENPTCWNKHILALLLGGVEDLGTDVEPKE
jgi:hypothetical protein